MFNFRIRALPREVRSKNVESQTIYLLLLILRLDRGGYVPVRVQEGNHAQNVHIVLAEASIYSFPSLSCTRIWALRAKA